MKELEFDVVVCGGGTAGVAAAIAAGRLGAKTLVVEQQNSLGGTQSNGWVTPMMPNYIDATKLSRGLSREITLEQAKVQTPGDRLHGEDWYDPAYLAIVLDEMVSAAGAECLFNATLASALVEGGRVVSIEVLCRGQRLKIVGKSFIDCTGDATLSLMAGAQHMEGNDQGQHQPMTLRFNIGNVRIEQIKEQRPDILRINTPDYVECGYMEAKEGTMGDDVRKGIADGVLNEDDLGYFQFFSVNGRPHELAVNAPRIAGLDPLDPMEFSRAHQVGRAKIARIHRFLRAYMPGFQDSYISVIAPLMGIRESRRVVGEYVLTGEDHQNCAKFPDAIARNRYPVDIHLVTGTDYRKFPAGEWHDIPYRSLVVKGFGNLWVAGRCASADFVAQSAIRIQPVCRCMGEAAGIAAARCTQLGLMATALPYKELSSRLDLNDPVTAG